MLSGLLTLWACVAACSPAPAGAPQEQAPATEASALASTPVLSPAVPLNAANPGPQPSQQQSFTTAAGHGVYLAVWWEVIGNGPKIFAARVRASDGVQLDASPLLVGGTTGVPFNPAVAFDGTNFLVVWTDYGARPQVLGARVRASDGALLDATPLVLSRSASGAPPNNAVFMGAHPAVAFDGRNYLVTWDGQWFTGQGYAYGLMGIRVNPADGSCIESTGIPIAPFGTGLGLGDSKARVAYTGGNYLVAWEQGGDVKAARVTSSGQVLDTTPLSLAVSTGNERSPAVAARDGEFLAVWIGADNHLWGRRVRASDGVKLGSSDLFLGSAAVAPPEITFDVADYWVAWQGTRGGARKALITRVTSEGAVSGAELVTADVASDISAERGAIASVGSGLVLTAYLAKDPAGTTRGWLRLVTAGQLHVSQERSPALPTLYGGHNGHAVAEGNGIYFVAWSRLRSTPPVHPEIVGVRVRVSDGAVLDPSPVSLSGSRDTAFDPAVAFDGTNFLVVWSNADLLRIDGARVRASDGVLLDTSPLIIDRAFDGFSFSVQGVNPSVAFDGTNYLVVWGGGRGYNAPGFVNGIMGIRVRPSDGTRVESDSFAVARVGIETSGTSFVPQVTHAAGHYLVAWVQGGQVKAARVSASSGQVLDTSPLSLGTTGSGRVPSVAAQADTFLVVWSGADQGLWGRRLRASDGVKLGTADLFVGAGAQGSPRVAFDGADYRVTWPALRAGTTQLVANRISSSGVIAAGAEFVLSPVSTGSTDLWRGGTLAAAGPGRFLVVYARSEATSGLTARMRFVSDDTVQSCGSEAPSIVLGGGAELTLECGSGVYSDPGAQAFDACGHALPVHAYNTGTDSSGPGPNLGAEGTYYVSYTAQDANGSMSTAVRKVIVDDRTAPTLTLQGAAQMTHTCGSQWVDPGVQATDACYGNLTAQVWRDGYVNGWAVGTYTVTYSLTDSGGNSAPSVTRTVNVVNCPW
ncbi:DUF5011 domain-containing protein [Stigmatella aurantiaca]|uniref:Pesticidal crystal protein Cry22Aa Ig-like domain-containing protein n=1 Tax=Stigmatella aurantiaca (strain DW4/3-1) TaxID=378806 RepID=E3FKP2_STIAD|nr:DUF5011 domain-containing protein [Stigmatella aurantiaca]ADO69210.1 uncharacterized protein STAUR_1406 [Stigmatella aurantiaca DW4/3-1]